MIKQNTYCLYFHVNPITLEVFYVGMGSKRRPYEKSRRNIHWTRTVEKYGLVVQIVEAGLSWQDACDLEKFHIHRLGRRDLGTGSLVNLTGGGDGALIRHQTPKMKEWLNEMIRRNAGAKRSDQAKLNISKSLKGRTIAPQAIKNMLDARKNNELERIKNGIVKPKKKISQKELERLRTINIGRKLSEEHKLKISQKIKGRVFSEEHRRKNSEANKGKVKTPEHRKNLSEAVKKHWATIKNQAAA